MELREVQRKLEKLQTLQRLRAEVVRAQAGKPRHWEPLPHQISPSDDSWRVWLLLAGRGAGKTEAGTRWLHDHVNGPPCIPDFPGGHKVAIVAPTLGDGIQACVKGPSGLRMHDPAIQMVTAPGGSEVRFPGGAIGTIHGTYSERDLDRLRAGGNTCLEASTLVATDTGEKPIENISVGDLVWTRDGLRGVTWAGQTGSEELWELETEQGRVLRGTAEHPVLTQRGFIALSLLRTGDRLFVCPPITSSGMGNATTEELTGTTAVPVQSLRASCYTGQSGQRLTGRSQQAMMSTIGTGILLITLLRTWNAYPRANILDCIRDPGNSMSRAARRASRIGHGFVLLVKHAGRKLSRNKSPENSVVELALGGDASNYEWEMNSAIKPASYAELHSGLLRGPKLVPDHVRRVLPTGHAAPVYNLQVRDCPEFFANNILTHNCAVLAEEVAAWPWLETRGQIVGGWDQVQLGCRLGPKPRIVAMTTPKPRKKLKEIIDDRTTVVTRATTYDNPYLPEALRTYFVEKYEGTRLGDQELRGRMLEDVEGALWTWDMIHRNRVAPLRVDETGALMLDDEIVQRTIGVDPGFSDAPSSNETGIVVAGADYGKIGHVLADRSGHLTSDAWGNRVVDAYEEFKAGKVVAESNLGGHKLTVGVIRTINPAVRVEPVSARVGKRLRAQPVSALSEQDRIKFHGIFPELEEQLTTWTEHENFSPSRLDGFVYAVTDLLVTNIRGKGHMHADAHLATRI